MKRRFQKAFSQVKLFQRNHSTLIRILSVIAALVFLYSSLFHVVMIVEHRSYPAITGLYWTLTTMSTLGYGDVVFETTIGKLFSIVVLLSGMITLLVVLPFTFIKFFYEPWIEDRDSRRTPRALSTPLRDHVILTHYDDVTASLVNKLQQFAIPYVIIVEKDEQALQLFDRDINAIVANLSEPETYTKVCVKDAALLATTHTDIVNTNIAFTAREVAGKDLSIVATANQKESVDILELAGSDFVLELSQMLGFSLARRLKGGDTLAHEIESLGNMIIAEGKAPEELVGMKFNQLNIRETLGLNVAGVWERGRYRPALGDVVITKNMTFVLAGTSEGMTQYNKTYGKPASEQNPVIIIGGGRVGQAVADALENRGVDYQIIEKNKTATMRHQDKTVVGNAASREVLTEAGIDRCSAVIITSNDDGMNIFLTLYCRKLRPEVELICRVNLERNVSTLHRAGADFVLSYAKLGANTIYSLLHGQDIKMITEGLNVFTANVPDSLIGKSIMESDIRPMTGCSVLGLSEGDQMICAPDLTARLHDGQKLALIGDTNAEKKFIKKLVHT